MKRLAIGIDIGGTNTAFGIVGLDGTVYAQSKISTRAYPDIDIYLDELYSAVNDLLGSLGFDYELDGAGIGAPNANYFRGTIESAPNLPWKGIVPFVDKFREHFNGLPAVLTNDAKAAAVGEMTFGAAKGMKNFIVITLGTGVGSGFVVDGKLMLGHDSFAGELGHVTVKRNGRMCGCGRRGCLETYASATGIKRTIFKLLADHTENSAFRKVSYDGLTAEMITDQAVAGDVIAIEAYEHTGKMLGEALANAAAVTDPEAIFLFGGLTKAGEWIFEPTRRYMENNLLEVYKGKVKLLPSDVRGMNAAMLGAASLVWHKRD